MDYIYLGKILQDARNAAGLKQSEIAAELGCTSANISSWERGKSKIDIDSFFNLCEIYNIDFASTLSEVANNDKIVSKQISECDLRKQQLIQNFDSLNLVGQNKLLDYLKDLLDTGNYFETVPVLEIARTADNRPSMTETRVSNKDLGIFDTVPQSDEDI